ncbi:MAG: hypothetical protein Q9M35_05645 [Rhodothermus sp.]|nr:hypothetical protein [Rhodothermus sp.]
MSDPLQPHQQGRYDGELAVEQEAFCKFAAAATKREYIEAQLDALRAQHQQLQEQLQEVEAAHSNAQALPEQVQMLERNRQETHQRLEQCRQQQKECEQRLEVLRHSPEAPSLAQVFIYGLAGVAFLVGDIIVSKEIVAQVLYLPEEYERWLFAVGLAALTFVFKITYDRLIELAFWQRIKKRFERTILTISALTLVTIIVMGILRAQEIQLQQSLRNRDQTVWSLEANAPSAPQPVTGPSGFLLAIAFALSGVMFAVAGAVCFTTAHSYGRVYFHQYRPLRRKHKRLLKQERKIARHLKMLEEQVSDAKEALARAQSVLELHETPEVLRQHLQTIEARIAEQEKERSELLAEQRRYSYLNGWLRGQQDQRLHIEPTVPEGPDIDHNPDDDTGTTPEANVSSEAGHIDPNGTADDVSEAAVSSPADASILQTDGANAPEGDGSTSSLPHTPAAQTDDESADRPNIPRSRRERGVRHGRRRPFLDIRDDILELTA